MSKTIKAAKKILKKESKTKVEPKKENPKKKHWTTRPAPAGTGSPGSGNFFNNTKNKTVN